MSRAPDQPLRLQSRLNRELTGYLAHVGLAGHLARYVAARRPEERSLTVEDDGSIVAVSVSGIEFGLHEVPSYWLFSERPAAIRLLARELDRRSRAQLNFPLHFTDVVAECIGTRLVRVDRLYALVPSHFRPCPSRHAIRRLDQEGIEGVEIPEELRGLIGRTADWEPGFQIEGIVDEGRLVAMGETMVRDEHAAAIQQIYTIESRRRSGLARELLVELARGLMETGLTATYLVEEENSASWGLAESIGFSLDSRWGYVA